MTPSPLTRLFGATTLGFIVGMAVGAWHSSDLTWLVTGAETAFFVFLYMVAKLAREAKHRRAHQRVVRSPRISHVVPLDRESVA